MKIDKGINASQVVDKFQHDLIHSEALLKLYPDLTISTNLTHEIEYFSSNIALEVDSCDFVKENPAAFTYTHAVNPYKNIRVNCTKCEGVIRVNSNPHKIPLFLECETGAVFKKTYVITCFVYEDLLKLHSFNNKVLTDSQLYIISKLNEHTKNNNKLDLFGLSNSIKLLLPFT